MFDWIKKRCKRRSLPPSIRQLHEEEITRTRAINNQYFNLQEESDDHVYEDVCADTNLYDDHDFKRCCSDSRTYLKMVAENEETETYQSVTEETFCPLCRSILIASQPCTCTNVYEEPCPAATSSVKSATESDSDYETPETPTVQKGLDTVYELATCPFKVPKPRKRKVTRSFSDAGTRPLPKLPLHGKNRIRSSIPESISEDDSSGYYESIGTDSESGSSSGNSYSDVNSSNDFMGFIEEDFDYEEVDFKEDVPSRRFSLGSATPTNHFQNLKKRGTTFSHSEGLEQATLRSSRSKGGQLFRSLRVRSLFKPK